MGLASPHILLTTFVSNRRPCNEEWNFVYHQSWVNDWRLGEHFPICQHLKQFWYHEIQGLVTDSLVGSVNQFIVIVFDNATPGKFL